MLWRKPNEAERVGVKVRKAHREQQKFIESPAKRKVVRAGRRSGKTVGSAILSLKRFVAGDRILYVAPTQEQTDAFWGEIKRATAPAVAAGTYTKNETERYIEKPGTKARIRATTSWSPDTLRSDYCDLLILDEWQLQAESMWSEVGAPMLLDSNGDAVFIYTPPSLHSQASSKASDRRHAAKLYKLAAADKSGRWEAFHFTSHANPHISKAALDSISYDMTALAIKQEILAEDVEQVPGALWKQQTIDESRVDQAPELVRVVVAIDPSGSSRATADEAGIVVGGLAESGEVFIVADRSGRMAPERWASVAIAAFHEFGADSIVAETNFGAEMVKLTLQTVDPQIPFKGVTASRGKLIRAEPISALYQKARVHHVGVLAELEEQLCSFAGGGASPGRLDALVWCVAELALGDSKELGFIGWLKSVAAGVINPEAKLEPPAPAPIAASYTPRVTQSLPKPPAEDPTPPCPLCRAPGQLTRLLPGGGYGCRQCGGMWGLTDPVVYAGFVNGRPAVFERKFRR